MQEMLKFLLTTEAKRGFSIGTKFNKGLSEDLALLEGSLLEVEKGTPQSTFHKLNLQQRSKEPFTKLQSVITKPKNKRGNSEY